MDARVCVCTICALKHGETSIKLMIYNLRKHCVGVKVEGLNCENNGKTTVTG